MICAGIIEAVHWQDYLEFIRAIESNRRNMYGRMFRDVKNIHDVVNRQYYSVSDLSQIIYN